MPSAVVARSLGRASASSLAHGSPSTCQSRGFLKPSKTGRPRSHVSSLVSPCLCRRQGSLSEVLALLAVLDFLTAADGGYTATRVLTVKAAQDVPCLARAELRLIFGPVEADPVRATAVMRLLRGAPALSCTCSHACTFHSRFKRRRGAALHLEADVACTGARLSLGPPLRDAAFCPKATEEDFEQLREPCQLLLAASRCLSEVPRCDVMRGCSSGSWGRIRRRPPSKLWRFFA